MPMPRAFAELAAPTPLLDLNAEYPAGTTSLNTYAFSKGGSLMAYALAQGGNLLHAFVHHRLCAEHAGV